MELDLDKERAARAAEAEATGEQPTVKLGGKTFRFPSEVPFGFADVVIGANTGEGARRMFRVLLGPDQYIEFIEQQPTTAELDRIIDELFEAWGVGAGEASGSNGSSANGSSPSKRTSKGSTRRTSGKPAGDKKHSAYGASGR